MCALDIRAEGPRADTQVRAYIVDRIGEFDDAGVEEIMFPPFRDAETVQRVEEEMVAALTVDTER